MPSSISKARLNKAFNEGRRSATLPSAVNPYDNPKLRQLWENGRAKQQAGELKTPMPPLAQGKTRARREPQLPGRSIGPSRPTSRPRNSPGFGNRRPHDRKPW